jgi:5-methylcytosine-specific restriction endonuclease McrA
MSLQQKKPRVKLDSESYMLLRTLVLERDSWRCQECGSLENLQVHHLRFKSKLGDDATANLITCHRRRHSRRPELV